MREVGRPGRIAEGLTFVASYVLLDVAGRELLANWEVGLPWYPPAGIAIAYLAVRGLGGLPWMLLARAVLLFVPADRAVLSTASALNATLATLLTLALATRFARLPLPPRVGPAAWRLSDTARFFGLALFAGAALGALAATLAYLEGRQPAGGLLAFALRYGVGDAVGIAVLFPIVTLLWPALADPLRERTAWWAGLALTAAGVGAAVELLETGTGVRSLYLALLPLGWAAARGGVAGAAVAVGALDGALTVTWALTLGHNLAGLTELQAFMLVAAGGALLLGAATGAHDAELAQRREAEARLRAVVDQSVAGFYTVAGDRFVYVNDHFASLLGYTPDEMLAMPSAFDPIAPEDQAAVRASVGRRLSGAEREAHYVFRALHKDGSRVVFEAHAVAASIGGRPGVVGAVIDRSALAATEAALRERDEQLRQAQKMEAVGRLAGGVAHDFNNMLTAIGANVTLALSEVDASPTPLPALRDSLTEIRDATARAADLTRQLLAFGRKQVLRPQAVRLDAAVAASLPMLRRLVESDVRFETSLDPRSGVCEVDPTQLEQVVLNLVVNARDAMRDAAEKRLTVATYPEDVNGERPDLAPGRYAVLAVTDTGRGLDEGQRERIFEPFFTTKPLGEGTGLGLATVFGIVRQSGGAIDVASAPGAGASFRVYLPAVADAAPPAPAPAPPAVVRAAPSPDARPLVLVVEDEDIVRRVVRRTLARVGFDVVEAADPAEALRRWPEIADRVRLVVTDMMMPEMDGLQLAAALRARRPDLRVLLISGYSDALIDTHGPLPPDTAWLAKPFTAEALAEVVSAIAADR